METKKNYCRICGAFCAIEVDVVDNRVVTVRGDKSDPETEGYTCVKGRQIPFRLIGRRLREVMNSVGMDFPVTRRRLPDNPLFIHPDDLATLGVDTGDGHADNDRL